MSYEDGLAAVNLEMPSRVPHFESSIETHWSLINKVTGIEVTAESPAEERNRAAMALLRAWNNDLALGFLIGSGEFGKFRTSMGHAVYAGGGIDFNDNLTCPFQTPEDALAFDPMESLGVKDKAETARRFQAHQDWLAENYSHGFGMTGTYVTLVSGLIELLGWDMLLWAAGTDPVRFGELTNRYAVWMQQYHDALAEIDAPAVIIHDDIVWTMGAFIHPDWYHKYVFPNYKKLFAPIIESGKKIIYASDGNYTAFVDDIVACGVHGFLFEPLTDMAWFAEKYGKTHVFVGNADTRILLFGSKEQIRAEVQRCMDIGKSCPGFIMRVGNEIPSNTPVENAIYYNEVYHELSRR